MIFFFLESSDQSNFIPKLVLCMLFSFSNVFKGF